MRQAEEQFDGLDYRQAVEDDEQLAHPCVERSCSGRTRTIRLSRRGGLLIGRALCLACGAAWRRVYVPERREE